MTEMTLGLDIGSNSIGWALIDDDTNQIEAAGVRIFPMGLESTQSGEKSKNADRRLARGTRRLLRRRSKRKQALRRLLIEMGLLPSVALEDRESPDRIDWERSTFKAADPYSLRKKALDAPLEPHELGRVLLHLNQRRGFKSNRKADREREKETSGMLAEISELQKAINSSGARTLGEYLADQIDPTLQRSQRIPVPTDPDANDSLRRRHTQRRMYVYEFVRIWQSQRRFHPDLLTKSNRRQILKTIFYQRPIQPPSTGLVGACELEPRLPRAPRADRRVQEMRLYQEVNNLRLIDVSTREERPLTEEERTKLLRYLSKRKEATFDAIRKHLFDTPDNVTFNLERAERSKMHGMPIDHALAGTKLVGKDWWKVDERTRNWIVAAIIDDDHSRLAYLLQEAGLDTGLADKLLNRTPLESGYGNYSLKAIKRLLPHVKAGLPLYSRDETIPSAYREAGYPAPWERNLERVPRLDSPPEVTNPIVQQALHEVRTVVNAILREHVHGQQKSLKCIRLELARDAKLSVRQRAEMVKEQRRNEGRRAAAVKWIEGYLGEGQARRGDIEKYLLWREQGELCIYTGQSISPSQLLSAETDVDHILPRWQSQDNSRMNRVVCFRKANADKRDRTPFQWLGDRDPKRYEEIVQRARKLPYRKFKRFLQKEVDSDFVARQLNDTSYITTQVRTYLQSLGVDVEPVSGRYTAILRRRWGLETLLSDLEDSPAWEAAQELAPGEKNRLDQRHHAVDALVVALTDKKRVYNLGRVFRFEHARALGYEGDLPDAVRASKRLGEPWPSFRDSAMNAIGAINVSYRVRRKASGQLHEDTLYGRTRVPGVFTIRKRVEDLSMAEVDRIRDSRDREIIVARLAEFGITPGRKASRKPTADVWKEPLWKNRAKGVALKKVRITKNEETVVPIRGDKAFVKPGNTHHLCLFEFTDAKGRIRRDAVFVTMLEAANRLRNREPLIRRIHPERPDARFLFSLSNNESILVEEDGKELLYRLVRSASTSKQMWFKHHCAGGESSSKIGEVSKMPNTLVARKVTVDPLGRIRWAND
ncbi:type II CRISPR RNA-guided endonuclease Cas9 [Rubinisphaera margarita]|uniref:type II CRISPR RNA-guided endonuclease Cas9 n=1 Tax=Rubinisphaera margarita TaxID=2909586 RepID=UPI001EE906E3|nr:type II CRISPR RNA-guided endonuclease Cas9 [Rubinisphaera margarita]MCG6154661.1 type II CRISPR RNA-guided endonuclease Cas9 [Rubinisphaera margarita]